MCGCHLAAAQLPQADSAAAVAVEVNDPPGVDDCQLTENVWAAILAEVARLWY